MNAYQQNMSYWRERTRQIWLARAIGATYKDIAKHFRISEVRARQIDLHKQDQIDIQFRALLR